MSSTESKSRRLLGSLMLSAVALLIGAASVAPFFFSRHDIDPASGEPLRLIGTHDLGTHVTIMKQFDNSLRSGVLYPRWLPDTNYGYGVATLVYYPPNIFYFCSLIHLFVGDWVNTMFVLAALSVALSGWALYGMARLFFGKTASAVAAFLYMLLPYHQIDLYWRGALPEYMGFVYVPLILRFAYQLGSTGRFKYYAAVGLIYGLYVMTHLPVSYLFTYTIALYALLWAIWARDWKILFRIGVGMSIGLAVCAIYWLPAALETRAAYEWVSEAFNYHLSYLQLFTSTIDGFSKLVNKIYFLQVAVLFVSTVIWLLLRRQPDEMETTPVDKRTAASRQTSLWIILATLTTIMPTWLSAPISKLIPKIEIAVPPFRWLLIASVFISLVLAAAIDRVELRAVRRPVAVWLSRAAILVVIVANLWLTAGSVIKDAMKNPTYMPPREFEDKGWIPAGARFPAEMPKTESCTVPTGGFCEITRWDPEVRVMDVTASAPGYVRVKTYNFPGWVARVNGQPAQVRTDTHGAQLISVPAGKHKVEVEFVNTPPRNLGTAISAIAFAIVCGLFALDFRGRKKRLKNADDRASVKPGEPDEPNSPGSPAPPSLALESEDAQEERRQDRLAAEHQSRHGRDDNAQHL